MHAIKNRNLVIGIVLTTITGLYLLIDSFVIGRNNFFLLLNTDLGPVADIFFKLATYCGDGFMWVAMAVLFYVYQRNKFPLLIAAVLFSTVITQITKIYLVPAEPRPTAAISGADIHTVPGVELHTAYSFPSGHTTTAFTIFLIGCLLIRRKWILPVGFIYALTVAYSRVYLAQHFPLDLGGGMIAAVLTILLSALVQTKWEGRK